MYRAIAAPAIAFSLKKNCASNSLGHIVIPDTKFPGSMTAYVIYIFYEKKEESLILSMNGR